MVEHVAAVRALRPSSFRRVISAAGLVVALVVASSVTAPASHAMRHLKLLRTAPAADTVLSASPDAICLWLSEPVQAPVSKITLTNAAGAAVALSALTIGDEKDAPLVAKVPKVLAKGSYKVTWKAMSKDGHVVNGTFGFRVDSAK